MMELQYKYYCTVVYKLKKYRGGKKHGRLDAKRNCATKRNDA